MTRVFLSTWGQSDNIGDSILRRGQLRTFQNIDGAQLHVHVGRRDFDPNSEDYVTAIGLDGTEKQYDTAAGWLFRALGSSAAARTILVMPTGEILMPERFRRQRLRASKAHFRSSRHNRRGLRPPGPAASATRRHAARGLVRQG